jgi:hypothetical protein
MLMLRKKRSGLEIAGVVVAAVMVMGAWRGRRAGRGWRSCGRGIRR